jgi:uncharacterized protein with NRDE domain
MKRKQVYQMCLILFAFDAHPVYKLIVAANRDESYARPTADADFWNDAPHILAGRDLEKMGTWMGVTTTGRFAALTNYRDPYETTEGKSSRGELVSEFLKGNEPPKSYLEKVSNQDSLYPGYNLLIGSTEELLYYSNKGKQIVKALPGVYGLSNHLLDSNWPKVNTGKAGLERIINDHRDETKGKSELVADLFALLKNADPAPDHMLPETGVGLQLERVLSPLFIKSEGYGTRSSTVCLIGEQEVYYAERIYSDEKTRDREFTIPL